MAKTTGNYSEDELLKMLAGTMENPLEIEYDEDEAIIIFQKIGQIQGAQELLRAMMGRDMRLYFQAQTEVERAQIKGGYARLAYIRGLIKNIDEYKSLVSRKKKREV